MKAVSGVNYFTCPRAVASHRVDVVVQVALQELFLQHTAWSPYHVAEALPMNLNADEVRFLRLYRERGDDYTHGRSNHLTIQEVVDALGVRKPQIERCIRKLADDGLLKAFKPPAYGYPTAFYIITAGRKALQAHEERSTVPRGLDIPATPITFTEAHTEKVKDPAKLF